VSGTDGAWMAPAELGDAMKVLSDAGARFGSEWQGHQGVIGSGEAGIGGDRIAAAFRPTYTPAATAVKQAAAQIAGAYDTAAAAGQASATDYTATDTTSATRFGDVGQRGPLR
jgi:hypothetical protein